MSFHYIHLDSWKRKEWFEHYLHNVRCTYSMTVNIDITKLQLVRREHRVKLYPVLIHLLSKVVNQHEEFRMDLDEHGKLGCWELVHPLYTVFQKEDETFSTIWTESDEDFSTFHNRYQEDMAQFGGIGGFSPKANVPPNHFSVSSIPWSTFTGFNLNVYGEGTYLRPIFTFGKYFEQGGHILLPLSVQVHHAVCDGFHVSRLINEFQELANRNHL